MSHPETLETLFGQSGTGGVDFTTRPKWRPDDLLVTERDNLQTINEKIRHCADLVNKGQSLAVAMDKINNAANPYDYIQLALEQMPPEEHRQFEAYQRGVKFGTGLDPDQDRKPWPKMGRETSKDINRLEALRRIFDNRTLRYENLQFFYEQRGQYLPLLLGMARVVGLERGTSLGNTRNPAELAEQSTATMLAASCSARLNTIMANINALKQTIDSNRNVVAARAAAMRPKEGPGMQKKHVPENERRKIVGDDPVGPPTNWNNPNSRGRFERLAQEMSGQMEGITGTTATAQRTGGVGARRGGTRGRGGTVKRGGRVEKSAPRETRSTGRVPSPLYVPQSPAAMDVDLAPPTATGEF